VKRLRFEPAEAVGSLSSGDKWMTQEQGQQTGTRNQTYDVIAVLYHALQGAENCQTYIRDAQDEQIRSFFEQARDLQRQLADQGKQVLQQALQNDPGGASSSAFGWQTNPSQSMRQEQNEHSFEPDRGSSGRF
jgi:hypothetical protein